jgi:hypothetical protein
MTGFNQKMMASINQQNAPATPAPTASGIVRP